MYNKKMLKTNDNSPIYVDKNINHYKPQ